MTQFIQRQIAAVLGAGSNVDLAIFDPLKTLWSFHDVYPSNILRLEDGKHSSGVLTLPATTGTATVPLPEQYDTARRLAVFLTSDLTIKVVTVSPEHATSTALIKAGTTINGNLTTVGRVTSITLTNPQSGPATVTYMTYEYPTDLDDPLNWRDGTQTTGVAFS